MPVYHIKSRILNQISRQFINQHQYVIIQYDIRIIFLQKTVEVYIMVDVGQFLFHLEVSTEELMRKLY